MEKKHNEHGKKPRVLVVDDELNIRRGMWHMLGRDFDVTAVESGDKAIEQIREGDDFDVVSLDLRMLGMSGIETLKAIKHWSPNTEVLIVTAHSDEKSAKEALKLGAYDYIDKPFKKGSLRAAVHKGVDRRSKALASEKAQEQLAFVKAQLMQSEKFSAIGELIAGVVHELNNPLSAVVGFSDLLLRKKFSSEKTQKYLENINAGALLCQKVIQKLLTFSRQTEPNRKSVQVNRIIESTLELKRRDFKLNEIVLVKELSDNMPDTIADFYELQQVFLNIINNAHHAMKSHDGKKTLTVKSEFDDKSIRISFQDTGLGIPKEDLRNIFEPLFTTKERGEGSGLGLSICYEIIQQHHGDIYVANEPGRGACFVVELPIADQPSPSHSSSRKGDQDLVAQNILVLSEGEVGCDLLENMLSTLGHHPDVAQDAMTGKKKLQDQDYDILIGSLKMPGLNAQQLCEYLNRIKPEKSPRIIFVEDGIMSDEMERFLKRKKTPCIAKPFGIQDIQKAIRKVLEGSS